ncbi:MAG: WbqC family protein [Cyclobacteriaceae bacterium]
MAGVVCIESHYLPSIEYLCAIYRAEAIDIETHEHFVKQSFRNRCYINTSQGKQMLILPVTNKHSKTPVHEIRIDHQQKWQNNHWRTIESAYRNAPFFEFYADELKQIIYDKHEYLITINLHLLSFCLRKLGLPIKVSQTQKYEMELNSSILDLRGRIIAKEDFLHRPFYQPIAYQQVFGNNFVPNLSFLDVLFCEGPNAIRIIQSADRNLNK